MLNLLDPKYVIRWCNGEEKVVILDPAVPHKTVAGSDTVVGAGRFRTTVLDGRLNVIAYDRSETLDVDSRPQDGEIIRKFMVALLQPTAI